MAKIRMNFTNLGIITGEKIQEQCDIYLGELNDFKYNPRIARQSTKCLNICSITNSWNNPHTIFVYAHRLMEFIKILPYLQNDFILVSHNSDENIHEKYLRILEHPKLIRWYAQNVMMRHPKLELIPIGIANSMWPHGNLTTFQRVIQTCPSKTKTIYFYFSLKTNYDKRSECKGILEKKGLIFEKPQASFEAYLRHLATHKYAICPPGNGIDSHRIWECFYLGVIPIVKRSVFTELLSKQIPCVILDSWSDFTMF